MQGHISGGFVRPAAPLTIWMKHSGDKPNCGRLVWILLRELYQKLKCSCKVGERGRGVRDSVNNTGRERLCEGRKSFCEGNTNGKDRGGQEKQVKQLMLLKIHSAGAEREGNLSLWGGGSNSAG